jgi:hypothetical protein
MQQNVGKFGFALLSLYPSWGTSYNQWVINGLRTINPSIKLSLYVELNEMPNSASGDWTTQVNAVNSANWWVRYASGSLVQWTTAFGNYEVNMTNWAPTDSSGRRWPQWKAQYDTSSLLSKLSGVSHIYIDNFMYRPRYDADLRRIGTNQSRNDPTIQSGFRQGYANYVSTLRSLNSSKKIIGNADNDLSYAEYKGKLDGAFLECQMGKSWSLETWAGWGAMMARYRAALANTINHTDVIFQACAPNGASAAQARYGFASALLENGYYAYTVSGATTPYWADEFSAPLGTPSEVPPTAANSSGLWVRHYSNGLVIVNPSTTTTLSMNVGTGYKHIVGAHDPVTNNGMPVTTVSLPPKSGLVLVKQ